jgi:hypothetical protein
MSKNTTRALQEGTYLKNEIGADAWVGKEACALGLYRKRHMFHFAQDFMFVSTISDMTYTHTNCVM